jgi:nucleoside-diphosphate-sugar epimerase
MAGALVAGGAGFIGNHLLADLRRRGIAPLVSVDIAEPLSPVDGVVYRRADVRQQLHLDPSGIEVIYNLAGLVGSPDHPAVTRNCAATWARRVAPGPSARWNPSESRLASATWSPVS